MSLAEKTMYKSSYNIFLKCTFVALLYLAGHMYADTLIYIAVIATFALFVYDYKNLLPIMIFFIPIASIMKTSPSSMAIINLAVLFSLLIVVICNRGVVSFSEMFLGLYLIMLLLIKNIIGDFGFALSYIRVAILLFLIPQLFVAVKNGLITIDLKKIAIASFWGVVVSSLISLFFIENPAIAKFVTTEDTYYYGMEIVTRFRGLSNDPNYFASLVLFCLSIHLFLLIKKGEVRYIFSAAILSIIGIFTLSKMYLLSLVVVFAISVIVMLMTKEKDNRRTSKGIIILFTSVGVLALCLYFVNSGYLDIIISRFGDEGVSGYTTGRSDILINYAVRIFSSLKTMFFGADVNTLLVGSHVTHNTFMQIIWKIGVLGFGIVLAWFLNTRQKVKTCLGFSNKSFVKTLMILSAFTLPLFALDKFFFDEFYWYYVVYLLCNVTENKYE